MEAPSLGMQICVRTRPVKSSPRDCGALAVYQTKSGVGRPAFTCEACQVKPLQLPMVGPETSHRGFQPELKLLSMQTQS